MKRKYINVLIKLGCLAVSFVFASVLFGTESNALPLEHEQHVLVDDVKGATCTEPGYEQKKCSVEGCTYTEGYYEIPALDHTNEGDKYVAATCTAPAKCGRCGESYGKALSHDIIEDKAIAATCTKTGLTAGEHCSRCDYKVEQKETNALDHTNEGEKYVPATCTAPAKCGRCGEGFGELGAHKTKPVQGDENKTEGVHSQKCEICKKILSTEKCMSNDSDGKCDVCHAKIIVVSSESSSTVEKTTAQNNNSSSKASSASKSESSSVSESLSESEPDLSESSSAPSSEQPSESASAPETSLETSSEIEPEPEEQNSGKENKEKSGFVLFISAHKPLMIGGSIGAAVLLLGAGTFAVIKLKKKSGKNVPAPLGNIDEDLINDIIPLGSAGVPKGSFWAEKASIQGTREYQQDYVLIPSMKSIKDETVEKKGCFCVLCDGMGGLKDGERASMICAETMMNVVYGGSGKNVNELMREAADYADDEINSLKGADGRPTRAGTTMISVYLKNGTLSYSSVGDSRIYVYRRGMLKQINKEHNYFEELVRGCEEGSPEWMEAYRNPKKDALTSYVGMGGIKYFDSSVCPIELEKDDVILLCSDGLYRALPEEEICDIINRYIEHIDYLPSVLVASTFDKDKINQDNTSAIAIKYLG